MPCNAVEAAKSSRNRGIDLEFICNIELEHTSTSDLYGQRFLEIAVYGARQDKHTVTDVNLNEAKCVRLLNEEPFVELSFRRCFRRRNRIGDIGIVKGNHNIFLWRYAMFTFEFTDTDWG